MSRAGGPSGYSGTPLWKKLGFGPKAEVVAVGMPAAVRAALESGVPGIRWIPPSTTSVAAAHLFATQSADLEASLKSVRKRLAQDGFIWVSWPKKSAGVATDLDEHRVRSMALANRLVDVKVCAVDEVWSGLKLVIRLRDRTGD